MDRIDKTLRVGLISAALVVAVLATFWPVLHAEFIGFDDQDYVTENPHVMTGLSWANVAWAFRSGTQGSWHPLTWLSHMLDVQLFGLRPGAHHLVNLLFHVVNTLLLFLWITRATGAVWRSAVVAALFALHPLHVEPVAWVSSRKDVLSTFFFLLMLWAYLRYVERRASIRLTGGFDAKSGGVCNREASAESGPTAVPRPAGRAPGWFGSPGIGSPAAWYGVTLVLFVLGLLSKSMLVTAPFVLLLIDAWPLERKVPFQRLLWEKIPLICLALLSSLVAFLWERVPIFLLSSASGVVAALGPGGSRSSALLPLGARVANAIASYAKYLGKTFWPAHLAVFYPHPALAYPRSHQWPAWQIALAAGLLLAVSAYAWMRRRRAPWLVVGWFWFLGMLAPVIGLVPVGNHGMADRYTYLPLIGIFLAVVWGAAELAGRLGAQTCAMDQPSNPQEPRVAAVVATLVLIACAGVSHAQARYWRTNLDLFQHALAVTADNALAHYQVGMCLRDQGKYQQALEHFDAGIRAAPNYAPIYYGAGLIWEAQGDLDEAAKTYEAGLQLGPRNKWIHTRLGGVLWREGKQEAALSHYREALRIDPNNFQAHCALGSALSARGDLPGATMEFNLALRLFPDDGQTLEALAQVQLRQGRLAEAETTFRREARLQPDSLDAWLGLGRALAGQGRFDLAQAPFREAVRLCATNAELHLFLGTALLLSGKTNEASASFSAALRLEPDLEQKMLQSGKSLAVQRQTNAAVAKLNTALWLKPEDADAHENLGLILKQQGQSDAAEHHLREAARLRALVPPLP